MDRFFRRFSIFSFFLWCGNNKGSPRQEENSAFAAYRSCSVVYVCDIMEIRGLGRAIFQFIQQLLFRGIRHKVYFKEHHLSLGIIFLMTENFEFTPFPANRKLLPNTPIPDLTTDLEQTLAAFVVIPIVLKQGLF